MIITILTYLISYNHKLSQKNLVPYFINDY